MGVEINGRVRYIGEGKMGERHIGDKYVYGRGRYIQERDI